METLGEPIQILTPNEEEHTFILNENALEHILNSPELKDLPVALISVSGAMRKGKSFLINLFLKYLNSQNCNHNWLEDTSPLEGFEWRGGTTRTTTGIIMWSKPFILQTNKGKVALFLMDTQGTFDNRSTVKDWVTIFALSTLVSSVQIFNVMSTIREDDFQNLQLFSEYAKLSETNLYKPFQKIIFLVRDWQNDWEYSYGFEGGNKLLQKLLQVNDTDHHELQDPRKCIRNCFTHVECCLLPHPGLNVITESNFKGTLPDLEYDFKEEMNHFIKKLLSPGSLVFKTINGQIITSSDLLFYIKKCMNKFSEHQLPEPVTIYQELAESSHRISVTKAIDLYKELINEKIKSMRTEVAHKEAYTEALKCYDKSRVLPIRDQTKYRKSLENSMKDIYKHLRELNKKMTEQKINIQTQQQGSSCKIL